MKRCSLCGGRLDLNKRCTFCGLDNTQNDEQYKHLLNQSNCKHEPLTHVHTESANQDAKEENLMTKIFSFVFELLSEIL